MTFDFELIHIFIGYVIQVKDIFAQEVGVDEKLTRWCLSV